MNDAPPGWAWFDESLNAGLQLGLKIDSIVYREKTALQDLVIYQTAEWGRAMALDGIMQVCERDEFIYHEMLTHVPVLAHGRVRDVCIVGGGDGGMLREALRHCVERVTLVEIDDAVIELCKTHLPAISDGAFDDPRTELVIADGARFMAETDRVFDVIIVDSTDPVGPGEVLFTSAFYGHCKSRLTAGGVLVTQSGVTLIQGEELTETVRRLGEHFADTSAFVAPVPTYAGGFMAFGWATDNADLRSLTAETLAGRYVEADIQTRYYNPEVHVGAFALPNYIAERVEAAR